MNSFIEFKIPDDNHFGDLSHVFTLLKRAKNNQEPKDDQYWLQNFPEYSLTKFYFLETDIKPVFKTSESTDDKWHFYSLIELLQTNYEITYIDIFKISPNFGRLVYNPYSYPYGGVEGLLTLIKSFNCTPTLIDDGVDVYNVDIVFGKSSKYPSEDLSKPKKFTFFNIFRRTK